MVNTELTLEKLTKMVIGDSGLITEWFVMYRDPASHLNDHWKIMGLAPTVSYPDYETAKKAADHLAKTMYYNVRVVGQTYSVDQ